MYFFYAPLYDLSDLTVLLLLYNITPTIYEEFEVRLTIK